MTAVAEKRSAAPDGNEDGADLSGKCEVAAKRQHPQNIAESPLVGKERLLFWVARYWDIGWLILPVNASTRKTTKKHWNNWQRRPDKANTLLWFEQAIADLGAEQVAIGLITGRISGVTVPDLDVNTPQALSAALDHFGYTPLIQATHNGFHLFYAHAGEGCPQLRNKRAVIPYPVDMKGAGSKSGAPNGGMVVLHPSPHHTGLDAYRWHTGLPELVRDGLPTIRPGALDRPGGDSDTSQGGLVRKGNRRPALLDFIRQHKRESQTVGTLIAKAKRYRDECFDLSAEPFDDDEVSALVTWCWETWDDRKAGGGRENAHQTVWLAELEATPRALWGAETFLRWLRFQHPTGKPFVLDERKTAEKLGDMSRSVVGRWRSQLVGAGLLVEAHKGTGRRGKDGRRDASLFVFPDGSALGHESVPNILPLTPPRAPGGSVCGPLNHLAERMARAHKAVGGDRQDFAKMLGAYLTARGIAWHGETLLAIMDGRAAQVDPSLRFGLSKVLEALGADDLREAS
jgi:hypothetical protein